MNRELIYDAVQAEVAYRTEELRKAGRSARTLRSHRVARFLRGRHAGVEVPEQRRRREPAGTTGAPAQKITR
jgi:hypothetical protein